MNKKLLLALSLVAAIAVAVAWIWMVSNPWPTYTVPAGTTQTIKGVTWHLDWMKRISRNDPVFENDYLDQPIEGAAYVLVQYTYSGTEPFSPCSGILHGDGRQWYSMWIRVDSPGITNACDDSAAATEQFVFTIPPVAVSEVQSLTLSMPGYNVRLQGRIH